METRDKGSGLYSQAANIVGKQLDGALILADFMYDIVIM